MAHIASVQISSASSSPPSQMLPQPNPTDPEAAFVALLTQASSSSTNGIAGDSGRVATANGANLTGTQSQNSPLDQIQAKIAKLLDKGISLDRITHAIASKLVSLSGGQSSKARVDAVANYLRQGENSSQSSATTAKNVVDKIKTLVSASQQQRQQHSGSISNSGNILDASQAGDTPSAPTPAPAPATVTDAATTTAASATASTTTLVTDTSQSAPKQTTPAQTAPAQTAKTDAATAQLVLDAAVAALQGLSTPWNPNDSSQVATPAATTAVTPQAPTTSVQPDATAALQASPTAQDQAAAVPTSGQAVATQSSGASAQALAAAAAGTSQNASQQETLGQAAVDGSLQVSSDLNAIASGQGTALSRALLRAANVDVARSSSTAGVRIDATLSAIIGSLDDIFASLRTDGSDVESKNVGAIAAANTESSLGDAAGAFANSSSTATSQTSFVSTLAKAQAPINVDDIMDQVVHGLSIKSFADNPTVNISLNPPHLGELSVKLTVTDATVNATVITQSGEVKNILLDHRAQLDQFLANAGLKLGSLNVDVSSQGSQQDADRREAQRQQIFSSGLASENDASLDEAAPQTNGPSMLGSVDLTLLNQLV